VAGCCICGNMWWWRVVVFVSVVFGGFTKIEAKNRVMPWMCLERCNETSRDIQANLQQIIDHKADISAVAFELFNLGPNSSLIINNFTRVDLILRQQGLETYAMVSSYPYPPQFLDWMRQLFKNPEPFIKDAITQIQHYGFTGYNIDFEPTVNGTIQDSENYVIFLSKFASILHSVGKKLTVDVSEWNPIWNWEAIGKSGVDTVMVMSTYSKKLDIWEKAFQKAIQEIPLNVLGIGLECDVGLTPSDLQPRFDMIKKYNVQEIDIWRSRIPDDWWPFIHNFVM